MCTSFVYRKDKILIGMNFDNDGKDFTLSANQKQGFWGLVKVNGAFFPSFGINKSGVFVNDLMVDSNGAGKYKRQSDKRWVTTSLLKFVMGDQVKFDDIKSVLARIEIVNAPNASTHNLIADRDGNTCIVEPGRRNIFSDARDSAWQIMTNFPLSDYDEIVPARVAGSGAERYLQVLNMIAAMRGTMGVEQGFEILKGVKQNSPAWRTELSLIYDGTRHELFYCLAQDFEKILKYDFASPTVFSKRQAGGG